MLFIFNFSKVVAGPQLLSQYLYLYTLLLDEIFKPFAIASCRTMHKNMEKTRNRIQNFEYTLEA